MPLVPTFLRARVVIQDRDDTRRSTFRGKIARCLRRPSTPVQRPPCHSALIPATRFRGSTTVRRTTDRGPFATLAAAHASLRSRSNSLIQRLSMRE
jgi:hypothetical protein